MNGLSETELLYTRDYLFNNGREAVKLGFTHLTATRIRIISSTCSISIIITVIGSWPTLT